MTALLTALPQATEQTDMLRESLRRGETDTRLRGAAACLVPLLTALQWRGDPNQLVEALPHFVRDLSVADLRDVLARLGYTSRMVPLHASRLDERMMPCLYETNRGELFVIIARDGDRLRVHDPERDNEYTLSPIFWRGRAYVLQPNEVSPPVARSARGGWFAATLRRFRALIAMLLATTLIINLLALVIPFAVMVIYDQVIGRHSQSFLPALGLGVAIAVAIEIVLRAIRSRGTAYLSARLEYLIGTKAFSHITHLPYAMVERAPVGKQLARLKEFEFLREFFSGPLATVAFDLPFVFVFLVAITVIAGPVVFVAVGLVAAYALLGLLLFPAMRRRVRNASRERAERHSVLVETVGQMRQIKLAGAEEVWRERFRELSARAALATFRSNFLGSFVQTLSHMAMVGGGVAVLAWSVFRIGDGAMTMGALIATMALTWRVLAPIQTGFNMLGRVEQIALSVRQFGELLAVEVERKPGQGVGERKVFSGTIAFHRVSLRYLPQHEPALLGVSLAARKGEVVALAGPSGSGKSSLLSVALRLYDPQGGTVTLDGIDTRQLDPVELRRAIAYVPQNAQVLYGTIAQNLRFGNLSASDARMREACIAAGLLEEIEKLPEGFGTRIGDNRSLSLPAGFHQRLALARVYLSTAPVLLLDEASSSLDEAGDTRFCEAIRALRGSRTILLVTHRPSHMRLADRVVVLNRGEVVADGTPDEIVPRLMGQLF